MSKSGPAVFRQPWASPSGFQMKLSRRGYNDKNFCRRSQLFKSLSEAAKAAGFKVSGSFLHVFDVLDRRTYFAYHSSYQLRMISFSVRNSVMKSAPRLIFRFLRVYSVVTEVAF